MNYIQQKIIIFNINIDNNNYYIINRDPIDKSVSHQDGKYLCNNEDGCVKTKVNEKTKNMTEDYCKQECGKINDCQGCQYNKETKECVCYNTDIELLLEQEFNKVTLNALQTKPKTKSGFGKKKVTKIVEPDINADTCNCGR